MINDKDKIEQDISSFFETHTVDFKKTKTQEWQALQQAMANKSASNHSVLRYAMSVAAILLLALGLSIQFYTRTYETVEGERYACALPDGSTVKLNAATALTYYPLKWYFSRQVILQGEAFFKVKKGSTFTVNSELGTTKVLGTSFNVYSRPNAYKVACVTGRVRVVTNGSKTEITPGESVVWDTQKGEAIKTTENQQELLAWRNHYLLFKARPLRDVFDALERQYNVYIAYYPNGEQLSYSGNISLEKSVEENLTVVCTPFQKKWEKSQSTNKRSLYLIN